LTFPSPLPQAFQRKKSRKFGRGAGVMPPNMGVMAGTLPPVLADTQKSCMIELEKE
jgi:hypothetical protein